MPLTATTAPSRSAATAARSAASPHAGRPAAAAASARTRGTRWAARGSAGRPGPRTRPRSAAHISKPAIVVERPVVGDAAHDREARPAVGAVDERVAVAAVRGVEQLAQAVGARRGVRRDERPPAPRRAGWRGCGSRARPRGATSRGRTASTDASGGASSESRRRKPSTALSPPSTSTSTPPLVVEHEAREVELAREAVDERAETHPLHRPLDPGLGPASSHEVTEHVVRARLRLLDPRDVLGAGDTTWSASPSAATRPPP